MDDVRRESYDGLTCARLAELSAVPEVIALSHCTSTMDVAHDVASKGAAHGTVIVADSQETGRGRSGNAWQSPDGAGVWASVILRTLPDGPASVLSLRVGLRLAESLDAMAPAAVQLKWPNDLYLHGRKFGGVLTEARWRSSTLEWAVVGIGLNVGAAPAGSAFESLGAQASRSAALQAVVRAVLSAAGTRGVLTQAELDAFHARDISRNRSIDAPLEGRALGITSRGALRVLTDTGEQEAVAGSLIFRSH
jgi:BirA family transcriptional regulator, biotin operon repressor / biotin---[acetyl-CoA-carboxylase] ligase